MSAPWGTQNLRLPFVKTPCIGHGIVRYTSALVDPRFTPP
jgi:hypothetical protein